MAQIKQKDKRTGIVYVYEAESKWDPEKKQSRYGKRKLVGHVDPATGEVVPNRPTKPSAATPSAKREFCGACELLSAAAEESGVASALRHACPKDATRVLSLAQYMVCEGTAPLSRFARYAAVHATPYNKPISSQRSSELLASLGDGVRDAFCSHLAGQHGEGDRLFYDTTSISSYSEALSQVRWGHNKDRIPLPQINLAMLVGRESGIPLYYRKVAGNISDVSTVKTLIADMEPSVKGKVRVTMDRGFWSASNINAMMRQHWKFLVGMPSHLAMFKDAVVKGASDLRKWENYDEKSGVFGMRISHEWAYEEKKARKGDIVREMRRSYIYLFYDPRKNAEAEGRLASLLRQLKRELDADNRIEAHAGDYDRFFECRRGKWVGKDEAIASACSAAGYFALFSNEAMDAHEALALYRDKDAIEKRFGDAKNLLDFRTPKVSTEQTLSGKLLVLFIALVLSAWLRRRMRETGLDEEYTLAGLFDEVETIERYTKPGSRPRVLEVTSKQRAIFEKLGYEVSTTS